MTRFSGARYWPCSRLSSSPSGARPSGPLPRLAISRNWDSRGFGSALPPSIRHRPSSGGGSHSMPMRRLYSSTVPSLQYQADFCLSWSLSPCLSGVPANAGRPKPMVRRGGPMSAKSARRACSEMLVWYSDASRTPISGVTGLSMSSASHRHGQAKVWAWSFQRC